MTAVFPMYVGVILLSIFSWYALLSIPHVRGGDPFKNLLFRV